MLYTLEHAAGRLDLSKRAVERLVRSGELASVKVGKGSRRVSDAQLRAYVAKVEAQAGWRRPAWMKD